MGRPTVLRLHAEEIVVDSFAGGGGAVVPSTSDVYRDLARRGLANSVGLVLASRSERGATFKAGYRITAAGLDALAAPEGGAP